MTNLRDNRDEIVARVGADNWEQVDREYRDKGYRDILSDMNWMWPHAGRKNEHLADAICYQIHGSINRAG